MDADRLTFLYGADVDDLDDLADLDVRSRLLERTFSSELSSFRLLIFEIIANKIFDDEPPEAWSTAQRLLAQGFDRDAVFHQLAMAISPAMRASIDREEHFDPDAYAVALGRLPHPEIGEIVQVVVDEVRSVPGIGPERLTAAALDRLGRDADDEVVIMLIDQVVEQLIDGSGPLSSVVGDRMVHVDALTRGMVATHRLTEEEHKAGFVQAWFDLAGFRRVDGLALADGEPISVHGALGPAATWEGPEGWLGSYGVGSVLAVRVTPDAVVHIDELPADPVADEAFVARLRAVYDRELAEVWLPVAAEDLVLGLLLEDAGSFAEPRLPLSELCRAAGLELMLDVVAHDDSVWHNEQRMRRVSRVHHAMGSDEPEMAKVLHALDVADLVAGVDLGRIPGFAGPTGPVDVGMLREVLADLGEPGVLSMVADELFDSSEPDPRHRAEAFADALIAAAPQGRDRAVARLLSAMHHERSLEPLAAEQQLHLANEADPGFPAVTDRLAWYASDRGDAATAVRLWRRLEVNGAIARDLQVVEPFASPRQARLGRNDRCWCGSGRKYKQCHLGAPELPPLNERVGWLWRKAVAFLERRGGEAPAVVLDVAYARAVDPDDEESFFAALEDPIVMDLTLTEGGWFEWFLEERGELLPDDEALLARAWGLIDRSVYEVVAARPGDGLDLRDLRSGEEVTVAERTFSRKAKIGSLVCARPVPDGTGHQFVGGLFPVPPGQEESVLDLLDEGDPEAIAEWVSQLYRPPVLHTREGEASVQCDLVVDVGDEASARRFLDSTYEIDESIDGEGWAELFPINDDEEILRARLTLDGPKVVVSTTSEERADRVLAAIRAAFPEARVVADDRTPIDVASMRRRMEAEAEAESAPGGHDPLDDPGVVAALQEMRDRFEQRWCDESIPALGGITPRQAADDPTRREEVIRLIGSFGVPAHDDALGMRPHRLRELLGLS